MPGEFSNPSYITPGAVAGSGVTTAAIVVADQAARLALLSANAQGRLVKQDSDDSVWCLKPNGAPANAADWEFIGYYTILQSHVQGLVAALSSKAPLASPAFTGAPTAPTAAAGTNSAQLATTAFVAAGLSGKANSSHSHSIGNITGLQAEIDSINAAIALRANLASPAFTGTPTAPTAAPGTNNTQLATTAFVVAAISGLSTGVSAAWGGITGTLSAQTDLVNALTDAKARGNHTGFQAMATITGLDAALTDAKARGNHTGAQAIGTISGLQTALDAKAPLSSPAFTGTPTVPTAAAGTNNTQAASTAFVQAAVASVQAGGEALPIIYRTASQGSPMGEPAVAASMIVDPSGDDNGIRIFAKTPGVAGNAITVTINTPSGGPGPAAISWGATAVTISPGAREKLILSGTVSPDINGVYESTATNVWALATRGRIARITVVESPGTGFNGTYKWAIYDNPTTGGNILWQTNEITCLPQDCPYPDSVSWVWSPANVQTGTILISPVAASAANVVKQINTVGDIAGIIKAEVYGSAGLGAMSSASIMNLSGGTDAVPGVAPAGVGQLCRVGDASPYDWYLAEAIAPDSWRRINEQQEEPTFVFDPVISALEGDWESLDWLPTTNMPLNSVVSFVMSGVMNYYQLKEGTLAESIPDIVRPTDFHIFNNKKYWLKLSPPPVSVAALQSIPAAEMKAYLASLGVLLNA